MNILLVNPFQYFSINKHLHRNYPVPALTLPYVASLIPPEHETTIIEEAFEKIDYDHPAELVCISTQTVNASRAYSIAREFRQRGKKVILGGPHASAVPDEAEQHCDAVAIGNAETIIDRILADAASNNLKKRYSNKIPSAIPAHVRGYTNSEWQTSILASRGCELNCSFCTMQNIFGDFYLQRTANQVLADLEHAEADCITFVDDNFYGATQKAHDYYDQIIEAVAAKGKTWLAQVRLPILSDEVLKKFRDTNCGGLFIGFESINPQNTTAVGKQVDVDYFLQHVMRIHDHGIGIIGSFIFGFDEDTPETIRQTVDFCIESKMEMTAFSILTPYPGTKVYDDLQKAGRIISTNWDDYDSDKAVFLPKNFTPEELEADVLNAAKRFYSFSSIFKRMKFGMNYGTFNLFLKPNLLRKYSLLTMS